MTVMTRDLRGLMGANGQGQQPVDELDIPQVMLVLAGRDYGPVPLNLIGDPPIPVETLATISDAQLKQIVANHFDLPAADLDKHVVVRPSTSNIVISEPTVLG